MGSNSQENEPVFLDLKKNAHIPFNEIETKQKAAILKIFWTRRDELLKGSDSIHIEGFKNLLVINTGATIGCLALVGKKFENSPTASVIFAVGFFMLGAFCGVANFTFTSRKQRKAYTELNTLLANLDTSSKPSEMLAVLSKLTKHDCLLSLLTFGALVFYAFGCIAVVCWAFPSLVQWFK